MILASKENHTWMIEEKTSNVVETLKTIELVEGDLTKFTNVRTITFLKNNLDVSTWGREYKPRISRDIN